MPKHRRGSPLDKVKASKADLSRRAGIERAAKCHQSGDLASAKALYLEALKQDPEDADILHLLGVLAYDAGEYDLAHAYISKAIDKDPENAAYFNNLGNVLRAQKNFREAEYSYFLALLVDPRYADPLANIGGMALDLNVLDEAEAYLKKAFDLTRTSVPIAKDLAQLYDQTSCPEKAASLYEHILKLEPQNIDVRIALGDMFAKQGRQDKAVLCFAHALTYDCTHRQARSRLNAALIATAAVKERERHFKAAEICYQEILGSDPHHWEALCGFARCQSRLHRPLKAIECYKQCLESDPVNPNILNELGLAYLAAGLPKTALETFQRAIDRHPEFRASISNAILTLHYVFGFSLEDIKTLSVRYASRMETPSKSRALTLAKGQRLKIGYVSGDFHDHPVAHFLTKVVECHDRAGFEIFAYSNGTICDPMTDRIRAACDHWAEIADVADEKLAQLIKADEIDILIDLSGHTGGNRLSMFALRPAPIQVSWLGFWGTTGLQAMDYILMDEISVPSGEETFYAEKVVRLPYGRFCFDAHAEAPLVTDAPFLKKGFVTFGTFNNIAKLNDRVIAVWRKILDAVEGSRLLIKYFGLDDPLVSERLLGTFAEAGIPSQRVELRGASPHLELLAGYGEIDIALDTFPFGGGMTSCEALWMGVPVVSLVGDRPASRQTLNFLAMANARFLATASESEYVQTAISLARNPSLLVHLRRVLRERMVNSEMCDGPLFTHSLEDAFRSMVEAKAS